MTNIDDYDCDIDLESQVEQTKKHFEDLDKLSNTYELIVIGRAIESCKARLVNFRNHLKCSKGNDDTKNKIRRQIETEEMKIIALFGYRDICESKQ